VEMLSHVSVETFKVLVWIAALIVGCLFVIGRPVSSGLKIASRVVSGLLAATISFIIFNLSVVFYILYNLTDPRWSVGKDSKIGNPELSGGPIFGPITDTLNTILGNMTGSLNDVIAFKNAFLTMPDFIASAGWGLLLLLPLVIAIRVIGWLTEREQVNQIGRNARDLADVRAQLNLGPFIDKR
jgi:hypothetical protein